MHIMSTNRPSAELLGQPRRDPVGAASRVVLLLRRRLNDTRERCWASRANRSRNAGSLPALKSNNLAHAGAIVMRSILLVHLFAGRLERGYCSGVITFRVTLSLIETATCGRRARARAFGEVVAVQIRTSP